ncbi:MAG: nucleoside triphosphate pyrophosphohydrolase family protein [Alphaproteobacteria bacterium]|nr:nucleoside triphosphate pyrophosphohydrolase family protein [Alphaproteobacteria bacterium]
MAELSAKLEGKYARLDNAVAGLSGESGEIADLWKKIKFHQLAYDEEIKDKLIKELGDVCWYLCLAANALNVPLNEIIEKNIRKLHERHPHGFSPAYMQQKKG